MPFRISLVVCFATFRYGPGIVGEGGGGDEGEAGRYPALHRTPVLGKHKSMALFIPQSWLW